MTKERPVDIQKMATKVLADILPQPPDIIAEIDNRYVEQLQVNDIRKVELIQTYAQDLERKGDMPISQICHHMIKKLKGIVSPVHIRRSLTGEYQKYKDADQRAVALKGNHRVARMPREYKLEELEAYQKRYLIQIIHYLHSKLQREKNKA